MVEKVEEGVEVGGCLKAVFLVFNFLRVVMLDTVSAFSEMVCRSAGRFVKFVGGCKL